MLSSFIEVSLLAFTINIAFKISAHSVFLHFLSNQTDGIIAILMLFKLL